jgi:hypothetical protein
MSFCFYKKTEVLTDPYGKQKKINRSMRIGTIMHEMIYRSLCKRKCISIHQTLRHCSSIEAGNKWRNVGFEVLRAVVMKSTIFWDITPCSPLKLKQRFGGTYRLYHQGRRISRARNLFPDCFLARLLLRP